MALCRIKPCILLSRGRSLLSRQMKAAIPATSEGHRGFKTDIEYKEPYLYKSSSFKFLNSLIDFTTGRFNENTRLVSVDGLPCVGKSAFAKEFAKNFNLQKFDPYEDHDIFMWNGYDVRKLNQIIENPRFLSCDFDWFYREADPSKVPTLYRTQGHMFVMRYNQYVDALRHILSTGQGAVLENNAYMDVVYAGALDEMGYYPRKGFSTYLNYVDNCLTFLWRPHVIIYLDAPNEVIMQRMFEKKPEMKNSPVFTEKFLNLLREKFETLYLQPMSKYCEVLRYDLTDTDETDLDLLLMDFENDDFMKVPIREHFKYSDWRRQKEEEFSTYRMSLMNQDNVENRMTWIAPWERDDDIFASQSELDEYQEIMYRVPELNPHFIKPHAGEPYFNPLAPAKGSPLDVSSK